MCACEKTWSRKWVTLIKKADIWFKVKPLKDELPLLQLQEWNHHLQTVSLRSPTLPQQLVSQFYWLWVTTMVCVGTINDNYWPLLCLCSICLSPILDKYKSFSLNSRTCLIAHGCWVGLMEKMVNKVILAVHCVSTVQWQEQPRPWAAQVSLGVWQSNLWSPVLATNLAQCSRMSCGTV